MWSRIEDRETVRRALAQYGVESCERAPDRVRLAILKTSEGNIDRLIKLVRGAKRDYRDALMAAEYPEEARSSRALHPNLSKDEQRRLAQIRERDRRQYLEWLQE